MHHADGRVVDDGYLGICFNSNPYTFLGNIPLNVAPDANLDRGLVMVTVRTISFAPFLAIVGSALRTGRYLRSSRQVDYRTDLGEVRVRGHGPFPYQVDVDFLGEVEELRFR